MTALLLAIGAATVLRSPRLRRSAAAAPQRSAGRKVRGGPREVVAELVHTPSAVGTGTAALIPPTNGNSASVVTERAQVFDAALLLPTHDDERAMPDGDPAVAAPAPVETDEFCEIAVWRGYAKSRFFARLDFAEAYDIAVGESEIFGLRGKDVPARTPAAESAHAGLVAALVEDGWEPLPDPEPWYATRFRRRVAVSNDEREYALET